MNMLPAPAPNSTPPFLPELSSCDSLRPLLPRRPWALGGSPSFPEAIAEMLGRISFTWRGDRQDVSQGMAHQQSHWRPLAPSHTSQVSITEPLWLSQGLREARLAFISTSSLAPPFPALAPSRSHRVLWLDFSSLSIMMFADSNMRQWESHPVPYPASPPLLETYWLSHDPESASPAQTTASPAAASHWEEKQNPSTKGCRAAGC